MSKKRSFETINYMLRPNKNVERKLIASTLMRLQEAFPIRDYRYVGFGSMWFTDFVLMHVLVGISDMVTIEAERSREKRVEFNKPFACISVKMDEAANALGEVLDGKKSVVWLDYDGPLKDGLTGDLETAAGAMSSGSLILVSVNAKVEQLSGHRLEEVELTPIQYLSKICESDSVLAEEKRLTRNDFPKLVAEILHARLKSAVLSMTPGCEYAPIWTFQYADDATMITVGGMIVNPSDDEKLSQCKLDELPFISQSAPLEIALPVLTEKEKRALDKLLPSDKPLSGKLLDFELRDAEIIAYQQYYREYPIFNELAT